MTLVQHRDIKKLLPGQYFRLSPQELGWFVRKGLLDCKPRLGYERLTNVPNVWVTWFAGAYEIRRYSHGINSGAIAVEVLCLKKSHHQT